MTHNLQTIKIHSFKAHLDRLQNTAEAMAELASGEVLAGRLQSAQELNRLTAGLLNIKNEIESTGTVVRSMVKVPLDA